MTIESGEDAASVTDLAASHGLAIDAATVRFNEAGLDYRVAFADDHDGTPWVLRIPRRPDVSAKIADEARILDFVKPRMSIAVPDWRIHDETLIAYPSLPGEIGLTLDGTGAPVWHFDLESPRYAVSLGQVVAELHAIDADEARVAGIPAHQPGEVRAEWQENLDRVLAEFEVDAGFVARWQGWLADDGYWPEFSVFTHGELYPAHVLLNEDDGIRSVLDWTTAKVGDPALDFMYQFMIASRETFDITVQAYTDAGGSVPPHLADHCAELIAAGPINYGMYALTTGDPEHRAVAAAQLNPAQD